MRLLWSLSSEDLRSRVIGVAKIAATVRRPFGLGLVRPCSCPLRCFKVKDLLLL